MLGKQLWESDIIIKRQQPCLPLVHSELAGRLHVEYRRVMNGVFWVGAPWHDLPERYGPWKTVYNRFNRGSKSGIIDKIFNRLLSVLDEKGLIDWSEICLDGSNIRISKDAAGAKKNISILLAIMCWVAHVVVMIQKSIWQLTERAFHLT
ncbi:transposase [Xenorhabdus bovienii str. Jollieti]|uniref:Transposase n=1 Tax=Xenorhabdus bovienii (strain SS-2004) TaxID=406818 RepID=D3UYC3_XENBS|nr:transposase [Xenorhabdus bovienii SS-2004]CDH30146.1 transposase [Xenorhabdus bovienii str. Jollieti]